MLPDINTRQLTETLRRVNINHESDDDDDESHYKGLTTSWNLNKKDETNPTVKLYYKICKTHQVMPVKQMEKCLRTQDDCLNVSYLDLSTKDFLVVFKTLLNTQQVSKLNLCSTNLTKEVLSYLEWLLERNERIVYVSLSHNKLNSSCHAIVAAIVSRTDNLVELNVRDTNLQDNDIKMFEIGMVKNKSILSLDLSHNKLGDRNDNAIANIVLQNECIEKLDLSWNNIRCSVACDLARALQTNCTVQVLNLSFNGFGDNGAKELGSMLQKNQTLIVLNIKDNRITNVGARYIGAGLAENESLQVLDVSSNLITNGMNAILVGVIRNNSLRELYMNNISPDATCLKAIRYIQRRNPEFIIKHDKVCSVRQHKMSDEYIVKEEVVDRIRDYISSERLRMADLFHIWDKDRSGRITIDEFVRGLNNANIPVTRHMIEKIFKKLDEDESGFIEYREFARLARLM